MSDPIPDNDLQAVAKALQSLSPHPGRLDRDRLMFDAGRASFRTSRAWPITAFISTTAAVLLAGVVVLRPAPQPVIQVVHVPVMNSEPKPPPTFEQEPSRTVAVESREPESSYARLQDHLLRWGLDVPALPPLPEGAGSPNPEVRIERGGVRMTGLFTSWLFSSGAN